MQNNRYRNDRDRRPVSRGYQSRKRREKIAPQPPKRCIVKYRGIPCHYEYPEKRLIARVFTPPYEFPSKRAAHTAIWHTVMKSGEPGSHVDYRVEEL